MSRRSSRAPPKKTVTVSPSVKLGIESLVEGNEATIASMLSLGAGATALQCVAGLIDCMGVNNLNPEALLARFFDCSLLATYCKSSLGKSPNGNTAVLASRIAAQWSRPTFVPLRAAEAVDMVASEAGAAPAASNADGGLAATSAGLRALVQMHVSGAYPIELGGVWIRVNRLEPLNVDVLPVFTQSPHKDTVDSAAYTLYQRLVVDDSDDCSETEDRLTRLQDHGFASPAAAIAKLARDAAKTKSLGVTANHPAAWENGEILGDMWAGWLKGATWKSLKGTFVRCHEVPTMINKINKAVHVRGSCLSFRNISSQAPTDPDFCESLGVEFKHDPKGIQSKEFLAEFVKVWSVGDPALDETSATALLAVAIGRKSA
eukprot:m.109441 g.109441  ORF g.109441 m.109441 type:complete len:375 (+) comp21265_c0_seq1:129-1253(+)